jgi:archaellum component FlaC
MYAQTEHKYHDCLTVGEADNLFQAQITSMLEPLRQMIVDCDDEVERISNRIVSLNTEGSNLVTDTEAFVAKTHKELRSQFEKLQAQLNSCLKTVIQTIRETSSDTIETTV